MAQKFLSIRESDFKRIQSNRENAPWIRLHRALYRDPAFLNLSTHHRYLYTGLLQLAYDTGNSIYNDSTYLGQMLYVSHTEIDLKPLYRSGLLVTTNLSRVLSDQNRTDQSRTDGDPLTPEAGDVPKVDKYSLGESIIGFLNEKTGKHFQSKHPSGEPTKALELVCALLKKGYTPTNLRQVIANRCLKWRDDPKMQEFLRPETLFRLSNFTNYMGELGKGVTNEPVANLSRV